MKYLILLSGMVAAVFFIWSVYAFAVASQKIGHASVFRTAILGFLLAAMVFFILIIVRKVRDDREYRRKTKLR